jgi:hypothetical protein
MILVALSREWIAYRRVAQQKTAASFHRRDQNFIVIPSLKGDISPHRHHFQVPHNRVDMDREWALLKLSIASRRK